MTDAPQIDDRRPVDTQRLDSIRRSSWGMTILFWLVTWCLLIWMFFGDGGSRLWVCFLAAAGFGLVPLLPLSYAVSRAACPCCGKPLFVPEGWLDRFNVLNLTDKVCCHCKLPLWPDCGATTSTCLHDPTRLTHLFGVLFIRILLAGVASNWTGHVDHYLTEFGAFVPFVLAVPSVVVLFVDKKGLRSLAPFALALPAGLAAWLLSVTFLEIRGWSDVAVFLAAYLGTVGAALGAGEGWAERCGATLYTGMLGGAVFGYSSFWLGVVLVESDWISSSRQWGYTIIIMHLGIAFSLALGRYIRDLPKRKREQTEPTE